MPLLVFVLGSPTEKMHIVLDIHKTKWRSSTDFVKNDTSLYFIISRTLGYWVAGRSVISLPSSPPLINPPPPPPPSSSNHRSWSNLSFFPTVCLISAWLDDNDSLVVKKISQRIQTTTGLSLDSEHSEALQVRFCITAEMKTLCDFISTVLWRKERTRADLLSVTVPKIHAHYATKRQGEGPGTKQLKSRGGVCVLTFQIRAAKKKEAGALRKLGKHRLKRKIGKHQKRSEMLTLPIKWFALLRFVIGLENSRHTLNQSDTKLKPIITLIGKTEK